MLACALPMCSRKSYRTIWVLGTMLVGALDSASLAAQSPTPAEPAGAELYVAACAACHGVDGKGLAADRTGFVIALPDFTDCSFASREPAADWFAIAHSGGPIRAFDRRMPAFGEALADDELERTIEHIREFCDDGAWPRGDLNLPRPLVTEKAFPEDEAVLTTSIATGDTKAVTNRFVYERRFGARNQIEVAVPFVVQSTASATLHQGLGDIAVAIKRVLAHSLARGTIVSVSGEIVLPTGKETQGLGKGTTVFEPFLTFGQLLPSNAFVQGQVGAELSQHPELAAREGFWRLTVGQTYEQGRFGRAWSPMIELLGVRELAAGASSEWDAVPQVQVTLSRRQHVMVNGGIRVPLTNRSDRSLQVMTYFLWDWYDGGLLDGWR